VTEATNFSLPDLKSRFRCTHCGNLTRFDVTRASKVKEFWHADMAGEITVEEREVLSDQVLTVSCRWCGAGDRIEIVLRPEFGGPSQESAGDGGV
jgi:RNase P subunit RPR2